MYNVDNVLVKVGDPIFMAITAAKDAEICAKVSVKVTFSSVSDVVRW